MQRWEEFLGFDKIITLRAKLLQSYQLFATLWTCSPPGSLVHVILQAKILEWVPYPPPGDLPDPGIEPRSPTLQVDSSPSEPPGKPELLC